MNRRVRAVRLFGRSLTQRCLIGLGLATSLLVLTGCGSSSGVQPGPDATATGCISLVARLPAHVLSRARASLDVAGAAAWGKPEIVLRCGVTAPGPTTDACVEADGLDWIFTETKKSYQFVTYGRTPAVEVTVPTSVQRDQASGALIDLADAVRPLTAKNKCVGLDDT